MIGGSVFGCVFKEQFSSSFVNSLSSLGRSRDSTALEQVVFVDFLGRGRAQGQCCVVIENLKS